MTRLPTFLTGTALALMASVALAENHETTGGATDGATTAPEDSGTASTDGATTATQDSGAATDGTTAAATDGTDGAGTTAAEETATEGTGSMAGAGSAAEMGQMLAEPNTEAMAAATASEGYMQVMTSAMERMNSRPMTGDAEIDYITMMIPHHQSAVDNSRIVLANTDDPEIQEFAQKVIDAQEAEIAELQEMLQARMGETQQ